MIIKPSQNLLVPGQDSVVDSNRRRFMRTTTLGAACMLSTPLLASSGLADVQGRPLANARNLPPLPEQPFTDTLREVVLSGLKAVPTAGGLLSYLGSLFIPYAGLTPDERWLQVIDARISEALFRKVQRHLVGLSDAATQYRNAVAAGDMREIMQTSISVNTLFLGLVPSFQISGEEVPLLPVFVIAATLHLSLLRDMALKGREIGLNDASITNYKRDLERRIGEYTRYVDRFVAQALDGAKTANPNTGLPRTRNQPLNAMLIEKANLQINVLDIRDTWHAFDAVKFPGSVTVRLNREVFSEVCGWWDAFSKAPSQLPDWKPPTSRIATLRLWDKAQWRTSFLAGFSVGYAGGGAWLETGEKTGEPLPWGLRDNYITRVEGHFSSGIINMIFFAGSRGERYQFGRNAEPNQARYQAGLAGHCLSSIRSIGKATKGSTAEGLVSGCIFGFQLMNQEARPISAAAFEQVAPTIAPRLLDWVTS